MGGRLGAVPRKALQSTMLYAPEATMTLDEATATVSSKGQIVIPSEVRRRLGISQGSVLRFVLDGGSVRLFAAGGDVRKLKGRLPLPKQPMSLQDMDDAFARRRGAAGRAWRGAAGRA